MLNISIISRHHRSSYDSWFIIKQVSFQSSHKAFKEFLKHRRYECETNLCKQKHYHSYFKMEFISRNHFIKSILEKIFFIRVYEKIRFLAFQLLSESENEMNSFMLQTRLCYRYNQKDKTFLYSTHNFQHVI